MEPAKSMRETAKSMLKMAYRIHTTAYLVCNVSRRFSMFFDVFQRLDGLSVAAVAAANSRGPAAWHPTLGLDRAQIDAKWYIDNIKMAEACNYAIVCYSPLW